jgi:RimJ/RimL family protein N-acetyltransferase
MAVLETERLLLCRWESGDWREFAAISSDPDVMRYINDGSPWSEQRTREFVERQRILLATRGFCRWKLVDRASGELAGFCGIGSLHGLADFEIGWWLAKRFWGRGLATEAARTALNDGFERACLVRVISLAQLSNVASIRVMEKIGMTRERLLEFRGRAVVQYAQSAGRTSFTSMHHGA